MAAHRSRRRRLLLPTLLAAILVGEITGLALARTLVVTDALAETASRHAAAVPTPRDTDRSLAPLARGAIVADAARDAVAVTANVARVRGVGVRTTTVPQPASIARSTTSTIDPRSSSVSSSSYRGRNHVWIPSLGINKSIQSFPCSRSRPPDAGVYRWGCAGRNNVYLLSHAWSTFKPLHDAYVNGRLRKGMKVVHADAAGRVSTYSVIWWRVTRPTTAASWAWAALSRPGMTLQTCVGANSELRLMVRLTKVG
jgi:hypothetical protein